MRTEHTPGDVSGHLVVVTMTSLEATLVLRNQPTAMAELRRQVAHELAGCEAKPR